MDRNFNRSQVILFLFMIMGIVLCSTHGWALDLTVTDVTTRSFSVVWTESGPVTSPNNYMPDVSVKNGPAVFQDGLPVGDSQVEVILASDQYALDRGIVKFEVIGLAHNKTYTFNGTKGSGTYSGEAVTEKFKGLISADPNDNDIVTNDIVHLPVYLHNDNPGIDPDIPALGVLVIAEIYDDPTCTENKLSDYPITAWVGDGMPGDPASAGFTDKKFKTENVCYKEYAALNLNNLFGSDHLPEERAHFPLQLEGDNASTPEVIEGEYMKVTVVPGFGNDLEGSLSYNMPVPEITKVGSQKISSAKAGGKIVFRSGLNTFTYPYEVPAGLTVYNLVWAIYAAGGEVDEVRWYDGTQWTGANVQSIINPPYFKINFQSDKAILPAEGYLVKLITVPGNFYICNTPTPTSFTLRRGLNFLNFTQVPNFYTVGDFASTIWAAGAKGEDLSNTLDVSRDKMGRIIVLPDLSIDAYPNVFVAGD
ncbi:MAG: hypothetical protein ACMUIA_12520, partial [bacterium]